MKIDHIGYAVKKLDRAVTAFEALGFEFEDEINDADRNIIIRFGCNDGCRIELVTPLDKEKESPVDGFLAKTGPTPYHICYISDDLEGDMVTLASKGFRVTKEPAPAIAFGGKRVVFMMNLGVGLIEIVEE